MKWISQNNMLDITKPQKEYELLDSGEGEKLERFGDFVLRRPDPQALWNKKLTPKVWADANASFVRSGNAGKWQFKEGVPKEWNINYNDLIFAISPTPFKHTGIFPEQIVNWKWTQRIVESRKSKVESNVGNEIQILNLFGYTGGATLACAKAGANVCHVDASKSSITWARENAKLSGLENARVRWILDDAYEFVRKEIKRGKKYDGIIMDPPAFGHGPNGEMWRIEEQFIRFIEDTKKLLSDNPIFFLVNGYASGYSAIAYRQNMTDLLEKYGGKIEDGELAIEESVSGRLLPSGIFARWSR